MLKKPILIGIMLLVAAAAYLFVWLAYDARARAEKREAEILKSLTAEDVALLLGSRAATDETDVALVAGTTDTRRVFLDGLREYLALAAAARREGLAEDARFQINHAYKRKLLLADLYRARLSRAEGKYYVPPAAALDAVWQSPENERRFATDMETLRSIQAEVAQARGAQAPARLAGGALEKARRNWAQAEVLAKMAAADAEFMARREVALRLKVLEAGILSADYLRRYWAARIGATDEEIARYLAERPAYDSGAKRARAESLLRRALAGEDFARLAAEASEDRATASKGGLYENVEAGTLWPEVESAALALDPGQTADRLIESATGWHLVKLESAPVKKTGPEGERHVFSVRHVLLQKHFPDPHHTNPNVPPPFVAAEEIARTAVEHEKRRRFVDEIEGRHEISLPDDFSEAAAAVKD